MAGGSPRWHVAAELLCQFVEVGKAHLSKQWACCQHRPQEVFASFPEMLDVLLVDVALHTSIARCGVAAIKTPALLGTDQPATREELRCMGRASGPKASGQRVQLLPE